jgi:hypothetical protein
MPASRRFPPLFASTLLAHAADAYRTGDDRTAGAILTDVALELSADDEVYEEARLALATACGEEKTGHAAWNALVAAHKASAALRGAA